jgi:5-methyltetrahydrofolate--homocysteine methyltransferase
MSIGASNVSFGLPNRHALNAAFMPMAMSMGLTSAIMDGRTKEVVQSVRAADLLLALDAWGGNWITNFRESKAE